MKKLYYKKKSKTHGFGLYASVDIIKNTKIIEYVGDKVTKKEGNRRADMQVLNGSKNKNNGMVYVFKLNRYYDIDGFVKYNTARFINHSCNPNCEVEVIYNRLWIASINNIKKGDEITYDYGYEYDSDYKDHKCMCGSPNCIGYILDRGSWNKIKKKNRLIN